jgi:aquaporin Z
MRKYLVEFIGAFFLVFTIGMCVLEPGAGVLAPLAIGSVLAIMIFSGGHVSGAHYNPAVTTGVTVRGRASVSDLAGYFIAQLTAGAAAASLAMWFKGCPANEPFTLDLTKALLAEFLFTFALANTVINVATAKGTAGNSFYGLAIGFTVLAGAYAVGDVSGGAFNPAVTLALAIFGKLTTTQMAAYIVVQLAAGAAAGLLFRTINPDDR